MGYRIAVIGAGAISRQHLEAIKEMKELNGVAIADINLERAQEMAAAYEKKMNVYTNYKEMVVNEKPEIVIITLPHNLHHPAAVWCAEQGCHVLLEKPMALNTAECDEIIRVAKSRQVRLIIGHSIRYSGESRAAKQIIESKSLGTLLMIHDVRHVNYYRDDRPTWFFDKAASGGGIMMNLGAHSIDRIQWLSESKVKRVVAAAGYYGNRGNIEGNGLIHLETDSGVAASICLSGYGGVRRNETEFIFTKGMMKLEAGKGIWISQEGLYKSLPIDNTSPSLQLQLQALIQSIETGYDPECSGEYGKSVIHAIEAVYESDRIGKEVLVF